MNSIMRTFAVVMLCFGSFLVMGQSEYEREIEHFRDHHYVKSLLSRQPAPFSEEGLIHLDFFIPDTNYRVKATFHPETTGKLASIGRVTGEEENFIMLGYLSFQLKNVPCTLQIYTPARSEKDKAKSYVYLGFKDLTTNDETFGGGRYLNLEFEELQHQDIVLDFNKSYNPLCAYSEGYRCLLIPKENNLQVAVMAGEKNYTKSH